MKLISLNTWGGRAGKEKLLDFFARYRDVDIFCLQEICAGPFPQSDSSVAANGAIMHEQVMTYGRQEIASLLRDHVSFFKPYFLEIYGLMLLVRNDITILSEGELFVHKNKGYIPSSQSDNHARNLQYVTLQTAHGEMTVLNFHGLWSPEGKGDTSDRLIQSDKVIEFIKKLRNSPVIFCGDFNLKPDTESLKKFETLGLRNLIKEFGITSTRTSLYTKEEKFADYTFVTHDIIIKDFKILPDEVSDHAAMYLEFDR